MSDYLRMKYHPAKKEVEFTRFSSGKPIMIGSDSVLTKYMNQKGKFVLQDHGNDFFTAITDAFDGQLCVHIDVVTTKNDYEDFEQMVEYYNKNPDASAKITTTLLAELPDMEDTYQVVKDFGEQSIKILERHQKQFFEVRQDTSSVKDCIELFTADVQTEIDNIRTKIDSMGENQINLCFTGVYSSGKSALINAILGYRILPENIKSETARMFRIQSPAKGKNVRVSFYIQDTFAEVIWDKDKNKFAFSTGPTENNTRKSIQKTLEEHKGEAQHDQMLALLKTLNSLDKVQTNIKVYFPIPLDTDRVQFTIYDTPGTDSNYQEHQQILQDALSQQTHSILIYVIAPDKVEGSGNNALLSYLKDAEKKVNKTSIDIARSLFVINKADTVELDARKTLQNATIQDATDDSFSIKLADKKLFFVSALYASSAKAFANGVASQEDIYRIEDDYNKLTRPERGRYYQTNRVATSEFSTQKQIKYSEERLAQAEKGKDTVGVVEVCSGLYALEREIITYGEKFASSVRAFAIIDNVEKALASMNNSAGSLDQRNREDLNKINSEIEELKVTIERGIGAVREKHNILHADRPFPKELAIRLYLDPQSIHDKINEKALSFIDKLLKKFLGVFKVKFKEDDKQKINEEIVTVLNDYTNEFLSRRQIELERARDAFISDVRNVIQANGKLSDAAKSFVLNIRPPEIKKEINVTEFGQIYDNYKRTEKVLWMNKLYVDKQGVLDEVDEKLSQIAAEIADEYAHDFQTTLERIIDEITQEFTQNIRKYSMLMQAKFADKEAMEQLREKIAAAAEDLVTLQQELNSKIWKEVNGNV